MHKTILTAGIALLLAGIAVPGAAYHIEGSDVDFALTSPTTDDIHTCLQNVPGDMTTHDWCVGLGLLIICEQEDFIGDPTVGGTIGEIKKIGDGGLCSMSAGHGGNALTNGFADCQSIDAKPDAETDGTVDDAGRSDGWGYDHPPLQGEEPNPICPTRPSKTSNDWYSFNMTGFDGSDVAWTAQAGGAQCDLDVLNILGFAHQELVVDELFLFWSDNGHLAGFPDLSNADLGQHGGTTASFGTYDVDFGAPQAGPGCDSLFPGAPMYIV